MGSAIVAVLHANSAFMKDLQKAKEEYRSAVAKGEQLKKDCSLESQALHMNSQLFKGTSKNPMQSQRYRERHSQGAALKA